jgi:hypothetical protein
MYAGNVTSAARRRIYWVLFVISSLCFVASVPLLVLASSNIRAADVLQQSGVWKLYRFAGLRLSPSLLAPFAVVLASAIAAGTLGMILLTFRKTVSPEIFFFSFWAAMLSLEVLRPIGFLLVLGGTPLSTQVLLAKLLLGVRYLGSLSVFISGLYAAGLRNEKPVYALALILAVSIALAMLMPVNTGLYSPNLALRTGYAFLNEGFYAVITLITVVNYLVAARTRSEKSYRLIAFGALAFLTGSRVLASSVAPLPILLAFVAIAGGASLYVWKLHSYYLWQ